MLTTEVMLRPRALRRVSGHPRPTARRPVVATARELIDPGDRLLTALADHRDLRAGLPAARPNAAALTLGAALSSPLVSTPAVRPPPADSNRAYFSSPPDERLGVDDSLAVQPTDVLAALEKAIDGRPVALEPVGGDSTGARARLARTERTARRRPASRCWSPRFRPTLKCRECGAPRAPAQQATGRLTYSGGP